MKVDIVEQDGKYLIRFEDGTSIEAVSAFESNDGNTTYATADGSEYIVTKEGDYVQPSASEESKSSSVTTEQAKGTTPSTETAKGKIRKCRQRIKGPLRSFLLTRPTDSQIQEYIETHHMDKRGYGKFIPLAFNVDHPGAYKMPFDIHRFNKRHNKGPLKRPSQVIIHSTGAGENECGGGHPDAGILWWTLQGPNESDAANKRYDKGAWFHLKGDKQQWAAHPAGSGTAYSISKDGTIWQHYPEKYTAVHVSSKNQFYIGIEHGFKFWFEPPTMEMYKASADLVRGICKRNNIPIKPENILPHGRRGDPGPYWDWNFYFKLLNDPNTTEKPEDFEKQQERAFAALKADTFGKNNNIFYTNHPNPPKNPFKKGINNTLIKIKKILENRNWSKSTVGFGYTPSESSSTGAGDILYVDEEIENSCLAFFLHEILQTREQRAASLDKNSAYAENIFHISSGAQTPFVNNILFCKPTKAMLSHEQLTNLEISNFVPFVNIYVLKGDKYIYYPFSDYTDKTKIQSMFRNQTTRGGDIGIKNVSWNTLATNQSNLAQVTVKLSILIQDISTIEEERNGIKLLDLLYPGGSKNPHLYSPTNHTIKMKAGWRFTHNASIPEINKKVNEKLLQEVVCLSLYKHSFNFNDKDGTVILDLEYIGMLETEVSNIHRKNILKTKEEVKTTKNPWADTYSALEAWSNGWSQLGTPGATEITRGTLESISIRWIEEKKNFAITIFDTGSPAPQGKLTFLVVKDQAGTDEYTLKQLKEYLSGKKQNHQEVTQQTIKKDKASALVNMLEVFNQNRKINILYLTPQQKYAIAKIEENMSAEQVQELEYAYKSVRESETAGGAGTALTRKLEEVTTNVSWTDWIMGSRGSTSIQYQQTQVFDTSNFHINYNSLMQTFRSNMETNNSLQNGMYLPYFYLDDLLEYFHNLLFNKEKNNNNDIILGSFSYVLRSPFNTPKNEGSTSSDSNNQFESEYGSIAFSKIKTYGLIGSIPISLKSLIEWYNSEIIDQNIENLSFYELVKNIFYKLVPININPKIMRFAPEINFIPSVFYETFSKQNELEKTIEERKKNNQKTKIITQISILNDLKHNNFPSDNENDNKNYIFVLSKYEQSKMLKGDYKEDLRNNILHFTIGKDMGLVKNISFKREDNKQLDAANIVKANKEQGTPSIIRQIYQLEMRMFGNTLLYPGALIHITPSYPGAGVRNKTLYSIGLGGYYRVVKVKKEINSSTFDTIIEAKWEATGMDYLQEEQQQFLDYSTEGQSLAIEDQATEQDKKILQEREKQERSDDAISEAAHGGA